ncbi:adenosylcobinamide-GDP ribazoletransferase [Undibacterium sp. Jales W-56]|uniref:adenosylcobinamide-GDP ribazoletransferase n=1 Tax=Undibacterium sp. Jales W-56 TaxID=2897325 RepID=UPI0021D359D8|nr:adenosylcobinamide-GDP ribazoletransferase [Undibacterium sp. Jales W-56]MCU6433015.1 adenosylcobinamide-GDP ribazoletransferase [Undibacterium sp. Jales W-56]
MHQIRLFFIALQFFTRIPIPSWVGFEAAWLHQASRYFPAVGWVVALLTAAVFGITHLLLPQAVAVILSTAAGIWLTGAFHEDGFADVCDGFGGGMTPERVLEIMKDSRIGAYGAIGICLMLLGKLTVLASMPAQYVIPALLLAHPLSRLAACSLIYALDYARLEGKAKPLAQHMSGAEFLIAGSTVLLPVALLLYWQFVPLNNTIFAAILLILASWWLARMFVRRIGGYTGDCLGAVQQLSEVAFYIGLCSSI